MVEDFAPLPDERGSVPMPSDPELRRLRTPPASVEAESSVLGGLLLDNSAWDRVGDVIRPDDFYRGEHGLVFEVIGKLIDAARREGADYAVDVYPHYGSDVEATLRAGYDIRHGLIGAGVYASHGYERSHVDGVLNTLKVLKGYLNV